MYEDLFERLSKSKFRSKFKLNVKDCEYIEKKGFETIKFHAVDFISKRVAPKNLPIQDGRQTPTHGHPVFKAQHATASCCRGCIYKWHSFPQNCDLTSEQQNYLVEIIMEWIKRQYNGI